MDYATYKKYRQSGYTKEQIEQMDNASSAKSSSGGGSAPSVNMDYETYKSMRLKGYSKDDIVSISSIRGSSKMSLDDAAFYHWANSISSFQKRITSDYSARSSQKDKYRNPADIDKYRADLDDLLKKAKMSRDYYTKHQGEYDADTVQKILDSLDEGLKNINDTRANLDAEYDYWSQWKDEAEYNEYQRLSKVDLKAAKADLDNYRSKVNPAITSTKMAKQNLPWMVSKEQSERVDELKNTLNAKEADYKTAKKIQDAIRYNSVLTAPDFKQYATKGAEVDNNKVTRDKEDTTALGMAFQAVLPFNDPDNIFPDTFQMNDNEKGIYNYLLGKDLEKGTNEAEDYLKFISDTLKQREGGAIAESMKGQWYAPLYSIPAGLNRFSSDVGQLFSEDALPTSSTQYADQFITQDLPEGSFGRITHDVLGAVSYMAPSVAVSTLTGGLGAPETVAQGLGAFTMGLSTKGGAYKDALNAGYTKEQAETYSLLVGASEGGLQYLLGGISKLGGRLSGNLVNKVVKNIDNSFLRISTEFGLKGFSEGMEEYLQEILDPVFRNITLGENNEFNPFPWNNPDATYAFLLGAVTSGLIDGPSTIAGNISSKQAGNAVLQAEKYDELVLNSLALNPSSKAYKLASTMKEGKTNANAVNVGELLMQYKADGGDVSFMYVPSENLAEEYETAQADDMLARAAQEAAGVRRADSGAQTPVTIRQATPQAVQGARAGEYTTPTTIAQEEAVTAAQMGAREGRVGLHTATYNNSNSPLEVMGISAVENGKVYVAKTDGNTAVLDDITFDDPNTDRLYELAAKFDTNTAKTFVSSYDNSIPVGEYYSGFTSIYGAARKGMSIESAVNNSLYGKSLPRVVRQAAYFAGQNAGELTDVRTKASAVPAEVKPPAEEAQSPEKRQGGVVRAYKGKTTKEQEAQIDAIDKVFSAIGRKVVFEDTITEVKGRQLKSGVNAYFDPDTNEYHIAIDGIGQAYMHFAVHESIHDIKSNNGLGYERLEEIVFDTLREKGEDIDALIETQRELYPDQDEAYLREEVVANTVPVILTDKQTGKEFAQRFVGESEDVRTVFQKILDAVKAFLRKTYDILKEQKSWRQMQSIEGDIQAIDAIREAYFAALEEISGAETISDNQPRFSIKEFKDGTKYVEVDTDQDIFDGLSLTEMQKLARKIIKERFKGRVIGDENRAYVNRRSADEFSFPVKYIKDETIKEAKMRSSTELENLLNASTFIVHEEDDGRHPEVTGGWDKYKTVFKVGKEYFQGQISVQITNRGRIFYDVTKIKNITDVTSGQPVINTNAASVSNISDKKVPQKDTPVKDSIRETGENDTKFSLKDPAEKLLYEDSDVRFSIRDDDPPKKTIVAYKAMRVKKSQPGKLFPLFVNANEETPAGVWLNADIGDNTKTKLGKLALRPGWHLGDLPRAAHIGKKDASGKIVAQHPDVVWCEVEAAADIDYQEEANRNGINKNGVLVKNRADIKDRVPADGYYRFKTNPAMEGEWIITGAMKINRILSDVEVDQIQRDHGLEPMPRDGGPIDLSKYGIRLSLKDVEDKAKEIFSTTANWKEAGYITTDGSVLDFSGKRDGARGGDRTQDHREISRAFDKGIDGTDALVEFMAKGNIRLEPESPRIDIAVKPNAAQRPVLRRYIDRFSGDVMIDFSNLNGNLDGSVQYPRGTSSTVVLAGIDRYFDTGEIPKISDAQRFRFSLKDTSDVDVRRLEQENARLTEALELAKAQFKLTEGHHVSYKALNMLAGKILKEYNSTYDADTLTENLRTMFDYLANAEQPVWEDVSQLGVGMARAILEKSSEIDSEAYEYYAEARKYLRETRIRLTDNQRSEVTSAFDSYRNYRNSLFGNVNLANDGVYLDVAWQELSDMYPELFDPDTVEGDMPMVLLDAVEATRQQYRNPFGYNMDEAAYDLFLRIYDAYFDIPEVRTFADKKAAELARVKAQFRSKITEVRKASKERYDARLKALRAENVAKRQELSRRYNESKVKKDTETTERLREQYKRLTDKKNEALMRQKAAFRDWKATDRAKRAVRDAKAKYRARIEKNVKDLYAWMTRPTDTKHVPEIMRKMVADFLETVDMAGSKNTQKAQMWRDKLRDLKDAMARMERGQADADYSGFYAELDPDFIPRLETFIDVNREVSTVADMDADQLRELDFLVSILRRSVVEANKLHSNARFEDVAKLGTTTIEDLGKRKAANRNPFVKTAKKALVFAQMDSFSFFDELGDAAKSVLAALRKGFDKKIVHIGEAMEYMKKVLKGADTRKWSGKGAQARTFKVQGGELRLTVAQIMELYLLNQREQARGHIYGGGIKVPDIRAKSGKRGVSLITHAPVRVTSQDVQNIIDTLTDEQKAIADSMQQFISEHASEWGNEAAMTLYGYRKFTEEHYWPIKTDEDFVNTQDPNMVNLLYALRNLGMTKSTVKGASNPLVLDDVFDTFTRHVDEMATYNGLVVPLSDAMKWFNYREADVGSIKQSIGRTLGDDGKRYFINLIKDINGVTNTDFTTGLQERAVRNAKIAAVAANLRVVIQQPTSYLRAANVVKAWHLLGAVFHKSNIAKARKYAPIAQWKSWGFYDLNISRSMREIIVGDSTVIQKGRQGSLWLAQQADNLTWGYLWNAAEADIKATRQDLTPGSEEFNQAVGERLSEIVDRTQVVDSVFHRSQIMRSRNLLSQMTSAFMAEPIKTYNMLRNAFNEQGTNLDKAKAITRAALTFAATAVFNAAAAAVIDAFRRAGDDEDKDDKEDAWEERWARAFGQNIGDNVNPLNMIPFVKDIWSLAEGFNPSRLDLKGAEMFLNVAKEWLRYFTGDSKWSEYRLMYQTASALSTITGVPAGNLMRTFQGMYNAISEENIDMESETATATKSYQTIYKAILSSDKAKVADIRKLLANDKDSPKNPQDIDTGIANVLMKKDPRIAEAYEARADVNTTMLRSLRNQIIADGFSEEVVDKAINLYENSLNEKEEKDMTKELNAPLYDYDDLFTAVREGSMTAIQDIYDELLADSKAENPADAIKREVSGEFKEEYIGYVDSGDTYSADTLAKTLKFFGYSDDDLHGWVMDDKAEKMREAITSGDIDTAKEYILKQQELGRKDDDIKGSITHTVKPLVIEAYEQRGWDGVYEYAEWLQQLELYYTNRRYKYYGWNYYYQGKIEGWIEDYLEKQADEE
ncbi:MAG: hypothetical protein ACOYU3_07305 [Bacillota bacterium]